MKALLNLDLPNYRLAGDEEKSGILRIRTLETLFEAMTRIGMAYLMSHRVPLLYESGVRYRRDPTRGDIGEVWSDIPTILKDGYDDCEGLAWFLAAEMRTRGPNSETKNKVPAATVRCKTTSMPGMLHAIVFDPTSGRVWDPSRRLGMNAKSEF
jgi:hypothetical protein